MICTGLHEQLRLARERRGLSLATIARQWGIREANLELIEQDRFEDLPTGLYGRAAVRAYATAVGLPGDEVLTEVMIGRSLRPMFLVKSGDAVHVSPRVVDLKSLSPPRYTVLGSWCDRMNGVLQKNR